MSLTNNAPLNYTEIARGEFNRMVQEAFLKAHKIASEYNQKVAVSAEIVVFPPDPRVPTSGNIQFSVQLKEPRYTSQRFTTALSGGLPVSEGRNMEEAETYDMFDQPQVTDHQPIKPEII